jgi:hypothetical protein
VVLNSCQAVRQTGVPALNPTVTVAAEAAVALPMNSVSAPGPLVLNAVCPTRTLHVTLVLDSDVA